MRARALGYGLVLLLVMASITIQMTTTGSDATRFLMVVLQAATLVAAVRVSGLKRGGVRLAALVALLAAVAAVVLWAIRGDLPSGPVAIVNGLLVAVAPVTIAAGLVRERRTAGDVTPETLAGVLAIYLLVGMFFSFLYAVIDAVDPGALFSQRAHTTAAEQLYFSFVTLSTVGYGDLTPDSSVSQLLAVAEMLLGQIYLVTVVALIIGHLGQLRERP